MTLFFYILALELPWRVLAADCLPNLPVFDSDKIKLSKECIFVQEYLDMLVINLRSEFSYEQVFFNWNLFFNRTKHADSFKKQNLHFAVRVQPVDTTVPLEFYFYHTKTAYLIKSALVKNLSFLRIVIIYCFCFTHS